MATSHEIVVLFAEALLSGIAMACGCKDGRDGAAHNTLFVLRVVREEEERDRPIRSDAWYASAVERSLQLLLAVVASSSGWAGATLLAPRRARMKPIIIIAQVSEVLRTRRV